MHLYNFVMHPKHLYILIKAFARWCNSIEVRKEDVPNFAVRSTLFCLDLQAILMLG